MAGCHKNALKYSITKENATTVNWDRQKLMTSRNLGLNHKTLKYLEHKKYEREVFLYFPSSQAVESTIHKLHEPFRRQIAHGVLQ